jgi:hypothetical protein
VPALGIEPQQMIAQKRQLLVLTQGSHIAKARPRAERIVVWHFKLLLEGPRGGVESLVRWILCIAKWNSRPHPASNIGSWNNKTVKKAGTP